MANLSLSYAGHISDRVRDLHQGVVSPTGIDLHYLPMRPVDAFNRMLRGDFDCGEMSLATYVIRAARGDLPFVAIPVFPARTFRHSAIYVNSDAGIDGPEDLPGKRVGVPEYAMTAAVWARGLLQHDYGVDPASLQWVTGGLTGPGRKPLVQTSIPGLRIEHEEARGLNDMLADGAIDALIAPQVPPLLRAGDPRMRFLFADVPAVERAYYRKTGIYPIMHTVVIRKDVHARHPWVAVSLTQAFEQAKNNCLADLATDEPSSVALPWMRDYVASIREDFGEDFFPYGIEPNRSTIEALCGYLHEQGIAERRVAVDELFAESVSCAAAIRL